MVRLCRFHVLLNAVVVTSRGAAGVDDDFSERALSIPVDGGASSMDTEAQLSRSEDVFELGLGESPLSRGMIRLCCGICVTRFIW